MAAGQHVLSEIGIRVFASGYHHVFRRTLRIKSSRSGYPFGPIIERRSVLGKLPTEQ